MRFSPLALVLSFFCLTAAAHADTYTTFNFDGYYAYTEFTGSTPGPVLGNYPIHGTITYDHTTASVSSMEGFTIYYPDIGSTGPLKAWDAFGDSYLTLIEATYASYPLPVLGLVIPKYELSSGLGGDICTTFGACYDGMYNSPPSSILRNSRQGYALFGTLSPQTTNPAPTPEPASISLLITGLAGVATRLRYLRSRT